MMADLRRGRFSERVLRSAASEQLTSLQFPTKTASFLPERHFFTLFFSEMLHLLSWPPNAAQGHRRTDFIFPFSSNKAMFSSD